MHPTLFLSGLLLCNSIPHLCSGLQGHPFPTPFAKPRGVGDSPPLVNFLWGAANLLVGLLLLSRHMDGVGLNLDGGALLAGGLVAGGYLSQHFGRVMRARRHPGPA
jgi:hypothetical protein